MMVCCITWVAETIFQKLHVKLFSTRKHSNVSSGKINVYCFFAFYFVSTTFLFHFSIIFYSWFLIANATRWRGSIFHLSVVDIPPVQIQTVSTDCGLFAIAFAYELAIGNQLVHEVRFDQKKTRSHLLSCFENGELTRFPHARRPMVQQIHHNSATVETFCKCKLPEEYDDMIGCDDCGELFHLKCVQCNSSQSEWLCPSCAPSPAKKTKLVLWTRVWTGQLIYLSFFFVKY